MTDLEQTALIAAALTDGPTSSDAYTALYHHSLRRAVPLVRRILSRRPQHEVDDMAHQAVTQALLRLHQFRSQSRYDTWLHTIVVRLTLMEVRRQRSGKAILDQAESLEREAGGQDAVARGDDRALADIIAIEDPAFRWLEAADAINAMTASLSPKYQIILQFRLDGWTEMEIAERLGLSLLTVKARTWYTKRVARTRLAC